MNSRNSDAPNSRIEIQSNKLKINSVTEDDEGSYECNAKNGIGDGISHTLIFSVLGNQINLLEWCFISEC